MIGLTLAFLHKTGKKLIREVVAFTSNYFSCNLSWPDHIRNTTSQHQDNNFSKRKKRFNYLIRVKGGPEAKKSQEAAGKKCAKQRKPSQTQVINNGSTETGQMTLNSSRDHLNPKLVQAAREAFLRTNLDKSAASSPATINRTKVPDQISAQERLFQANKKHLLESQILTHSQTGSSSNKNVCFTKSLAKLPSNNRGK